MKILYVITILAIYTLFMLIHKTEKKQNLISWIALTTILILCYNIFVCTIFTFVGILCTLTNLSIFNSIIIAILSIILFRSKKAQKYHVKWLDIIFAILLLIMVIVIAYKQYGFPFNIRYHTTDGSSHYFYAEQFYKNSALLYKGTTDDIFELFGAEFRLPGAYVNEGIFFKVFDKTAPLIDLFIIFDLFVLYMSGILFYCLLKKYAKENIKLQILSMIISILYMLGYQLNSMLYGYIYLSFAIDIIIALILFITNYEKEEIPNAVALPSLALLSFGIFFSYAYFIPIIYIAIIANIIIKSIENKEEIVSSQNIIKIMFMIINPLILGITYFILIPMASGKETEISSIIIDGVIYKNYITNLVAFIPIFMIGTIVSIKNKKSEDNFSIILFILSIIFAIILLIGNKLGKVSEYYFFKAYFIIWPLAINNAFIAISSIITNKNKTLKIGTYAYISIYIIAILVSTLILNKNIGINDIFYKNAEIIKNEKYVLKSEEIDLLEKVKDTIESNQLYVATSQKKGRMKWLYALYQNQYIYTEYVFAHHGEIERWLSEEKKYYLAYYEEYNKIENREPLDENSNKYKIIYNDEYGFILERK